MIRKYCKACDKLFWVKPYRAETARFCSRKCWVTTLESKAIVSKTQKARHKRSPTIGTKNPNFKGLIKMCLNCGAKFKTYPSRKRKFCSYKCAMKLIKSEAL